MNANMTSAAKKPSLIYLYKLLLCCFLALAFTPALFSQSLSRTYTGDLEVKEFSNFICNGVQYRLNVNGSMSSNGTDEVTNITADDWNTPVFTISKVVDIATHDLNVIKYEVLVEAEGEDAQALLDQLKFCLTDRPEGTHFNPLMNISGVNIANGWFRSDKSEIILNNNTKYQLSRFKISSKVTIPEKSNLMLSGHNTFYKVEEVEGHLNADIKNGIIRAQGAPVGSVTGLFSEIELGTFGEARLSLNNCRFRAKQIGQAEITGERSKIQIDESDILKVESSATDEYYLPSGGSLFTKETYFSNIEIGKLHKALDVRLINGDISIKQIQPSFEKAVFRNQLSTIRLGVEMLENLTFEPVKALNTEFNGFESLGLKPNQFSTKGNPQKGGKLVLHCNNCRVVLEDY